MRASLMYCLAAIGLLTATTPSQAQERTYTYDVVHPVYGTIGTFTESIARHDGATRSTAQLHVTVRVMGIVFHPRTPTIPRSSAATG